MLGEIKILSIPTERNFKARDQVESSEWPQGGVIVGNKQAPLACKKSSSFLRREMKWMSSQMEGLDSTTTPLSQ